MRRQRARQCHQLADPCGSPAPAKKDTKAKNKTPGGGEGRRGKGGKASAAKGKKGPARDAKKKPATAEELDASMDDYWLKSQNKEIVAKKLDDEMDSYWEKKGKAADTTGEEAAATTTAEVKDSNAEE